MDKFSPFKTAIVVVSIVIAVFALLVFSGRVPFFSSSSDANTLTGDVVIWGTVPEQEMSAAMSTLAQNVKTYTVTYREVPVQTFVPELVNSIANGTNPDLIIAPHDIILNQYDKLNVIPYTSMSEADYKSVYVPSAEVFLRTNGIQALPIAIDPMVMYYNKDIMAKYGVINPPASWDDVVKSAEQITEAGSVDGEFKTSVIPFGSYGNYKYSKDIVAAILEQFGTPLIARSATGLGVGLYDNDGVSNLNSIIKYMNDFSNPNLTTFTWSVRMPDAFEAFVSNRLLFYPAYMSDNKSIASANPRLQYDYSYLPQTPNTNRFFTSAKIVGISQLTSSKSPAAAFNAMSIISQPEWTNAIAGYIGSPSARKDSLAGNNGTQYAVLASKSAIAGKVMYDKAPITSSNLVNQMFNDIVSNRYNIGEAVQNFLIAVAKIYK